MLPAVSSGEAGKTWCCSDRMNDCQVLCGLCSGCLSHIVFTVVDVHPVCPTLMTHPLQTGWLLGGALCCWWSWPSCGWVLPVSQLTPVVCPASLLVKVIKDVQCDGSFMTQTVLSSHVIPHVSTSQSHIRYRETGKFSFWVRLKKKKYRLMKAWVELSTQIKI